MNDVVLSVGGDTVYTKKYYQLTFILSADNRYLDDR